MSINDRLKQLKNKVETDKGLTLSVNPSNEILDSQYMNLDFNQLGELSPEETQLLKTGTIQIWTTMSKSFTLIGKILAETQEKLSKDDIFLSWLDMIQIKKSSAYNYIKRYKFILNYQDKKDLIESLPIGVSYQLAYCKDENTISQILNKEIVDLNIIKSILKENKALEHNNDESTKNNNEVNFSDFDFDNLITDTFSIVSNNLGNLSPTKKQQVSTLLLKLKHLLES